MKTFGKIYGGVLAGFGILIDAIDIISIYQVTATGSVPTDTFHIGFDLASLLVIGTLMAVGGIYVFMKSR